MKLTKEQSDAALAAFTNYFVRNYPGPNTIISNPNWHAPKIFRAALSAIEIHGGTSVPNSESISGETGVDHDLG